MAKKEKTDEKTQQGCVLYVDGGCRPGYIQQPDTKYGGWGLHGYTYTIGVHPPKLRTKKDIPTIRGYQIGEETTLEEQVVPTQYIDAYGSMSEQDDSAKAELEGFTQAIKYAMTKDFKQIHLLLDNQYVINGVNGGFDKWENMKWKKADGGNYSNRELWERLMRDYKPFNAEDICKVTWVNGHSGNLGNDRADYLATKGVYLGRNGVMFKHQIKESPIAKYRDPKPEINRLFVKNRWYFNTDEKPIMSPCGRYVYHCGAHGSDDTLIGKAMSDSVAYIVYTKEEQTLLEKVRQFHRKMIPNPYNELCMARLDTLLLPRIYQEIMDDGVEVLSLAPRKMKYEGLCTIDEQMATKVIRPSGLTFKLIDTHNFMEKQLNSFIQGDNVTTTDITDLIYQERKVKKEIVYDLTFTSTTKILRPMVKLQEGQEHKCALTIGIDCPPRELLNAIKDRKPKVYVMTWRLSSAAFRYAMIFDCGEDIMMWMGKDSSMQLVYPEEMLKG